VAKTCFENSDAQPTKDKEEDEK